VSAPLPSSNPVPIGASRRRILFGGVIVLAAVGAGAYYLFRPAPPPIPAVDLSRVDPEVADAVTTAIDAVKAHPRDGAAWGHLGMILRAHDFEMPSVEALRAAERFDPENSKWPYLQGLTLVLIDPDAGLDCLQRAAAKAPDDRPEPRLRLAEALLDRGQVTEAEATVQPIVERRPSEPRAGLLLTRTATYREDWAAVLARSEPIRNDPTARRRVTLLRADALRRLGRTADANDEAARAAELPEDEPWYDRYISEVMELQVGGNVDFERGKTLLDSGRPAEATVVLERAVAKARNPAPARLLLGKALNQSGNPAEARRILTEAIRTDPSLVEGWFQLGLAEYLVGNLAAAAEAFDQVVKLKPDHTLGYLNLGHVRKKLGDKPGAAAAYEAALRCRPDYEPARQALAELRNKK
jgi:tetratricopeptide (TPR) repeat protein